MAVVQQPPRLRLAHYTQVAERIRPPAKLACKAHTVAFKNFGDGLLDYMEAGPKLRKWYGEGERRPQDGKEPDPEDEEELSGPADSILVTDADCPTGELVLLQLILARLKVVALVKDAVAAHNAYGAYVRPVQGRVGDASSVQKALGAAKAVICPSGTGCLPQMLSNSKIAHAVLLSSVGAGQPGILGRLLGGEQVLLQDPSREEDLRASGVPLSIVRVGKVVDRPGGANELKFSQGDAPGEGEISREDVAQTLVRALQKPPKHSLAFAVSSHSTGQQTQWDSLFLSLKEVPMTQL